MNNVFQQVQTEGLTGNIQFHENGTRKYFSVDVIELGENSVHNKVRTTVLESASNLYYRQITHVMIDSVIVCDFQIGQWSDFGGFKAEASFQKSGLSSTQVIPDDVNTNKMYIVTSILVSQLISYNLSSWPYNT